MTPDQVRPLCSAAAEAVPTLVEDASKSQKLVERPFKGIGEDIKRKARRLPCATGQSTVLHVRAHRPSCT